MFTRRVLAVVAVLLALMGMFAMGVSAEVRQGVRHFWAEVYLPDGTPAVGAGTWHEDDLGWYRGMGFADSHGHVGLIFGENQEDLLLSATYLKVQKVTVGGATYDGILYEGKSMTKNGHAKIVLRPTWYVRWHNWGAWGQHLLERQVQ